MSAGTETRLVLCPKCHGQGHVNTPPWVPGDQPTYMSSDTRSYTCRVCSGVGYIEVVAKP